MPLKKINRIISTCILLVLLIISIVLFINSLIQSPSIQKHLIDRLSWAAGIDIQTGGIELDLWRGIGISISDIEAGPDPKGNKIMASRMKITLDVKELIKGHIVPISLYLLAPEVELASIGSASSLQPETISLSKKLSSLGELGIQSIFIERGRVNINEWPLEFEVRSLDIAQNKQEPFKYVLTANGTADISEVKTPFQVRGIILSPLQGKEKYSIDLTLNTGEAPIGLIPLPKSVCVNKGKFKTELYISGDLGDKISINGQVHIKSCHFSLIRSSRQKEISLPELSIDFKSQLNGRVLNAPSIKLKGPDYILGAAAKLDLEDMKNPHLDIIGDSDLMKIETFKALFPTQILPVWLEEKLFPIMVDGDIRFNLFKLDGSMEQIRKIRLPENHSVLEMDLEFDNLYITGQGIQIPFKEVFADLFLSKGNMQISNLKAGFGDSIIEEACVDIIDVYSKTPYFETSINGSFNLEELIKQKEMGFIPVNIKKQVEEIETLSGDLRCRTVIGYKYGWDSIKILWGELLFEECVLDHKSLHYPLLVDSAEFLLSEDNVNRFRGNGLWGNSTFQIAGDFSISGKDIQIQKADLFSDVDMYQVIPLFPKSTSFPVAYREPVALKVSAVRNADTWSLQGRVELDGILFINEAFLIDPPGKGDYLLFDLDYGFDGKIILNNALARVGTSDIFFSGSLDPVNDNILYMGLSSSHLSIRDTGFRLKSIRTRVEGILNGDLELKIPLFKDEEIIISGQIMGNNLSLAPMIFNSPIQEGDFRITVSGKQVDIDFMKFKIGESDISVVGSLDGRDDLKGQISVTSGFLDTADIIPPESSSVLGYRPGPMNSLMKNLNLDIDLNILKGQWRGLSWEPLKADLDLVAGDLFIKSSKINLEYGSLDITGQILRGTDSEMAFNGIIYLKKQPVDKLLNDIGFNYHNLKGDLTMAAKLSMHGKRKEDLIPSLTGSADISIQTGLIKNPNTFIKVLEDLSLKDIFKERPPDLREKGLYFKSIQAEAEITQGILETENFTMKSPVFNAVAYGKCDLYRKTVDFTLATQPHGTVDTIVSSIPIVGFIITGEDKSVLAYTFEVKGKISDPEVTFIPIETMGKGVIGIMERLLTTPARILKGLQNSTKNNQKEVPVQPEQ